MKKLLFFVLAFCLVLPLAAQKNKKKVSRHAAKMGFQQVDVFGAKYCKKKVGNWDNPREKAAVVLFLHGAGERGSDNSSQLTHGAAQILRYCKETKMKALLIFPQCPSDQQWVNVPWGETEHTMPPKPSSALSLALTVLDQECADRAIDKDRIYGIFSAAIRKSLPGRSPFAAVQIQNKRTISSLHLFCSIMATKTMWFRWNAAARSMKH